jgi:hypothetical protein
MYSPLNQNGEGVMVAGSSGGNWMIRAYDVNGMLDSNVNGAPTGTGIITYNPGTTDEARGIFVGGDTIIAAGTAGGAPSGWRVRTWDLDTGTVGTTMQWNPAGGAEVRGMCWNDDWGGSMFIVGRTGAAGSRDWAIKRTTWDWSGWDTFESTAANSAYVWNPGGTEDEAVSCTAQGDQLFVAGTTGTGLNDDGRIKAFWDDGWSYNWFGTNSVVSFGTAGVDDNVYDIINDPWADNVVVAGQDPANGGQAILRRYDHDGDIDTSWGAGGVITWDQAVGTAESARTVFMDDSSNLFVGVQAGTNGGDGAIRRYDYHGDLTTALANGTIRVNWRGAWDRPSKVTANDLVKIGLGSDAGDILVDLESEDARLESRNTFNLTSKGTIRASTDSPLVSHNDMLLNGGFIANLGEVRLEHQDYRAELAVAPTVQLHDLSVIGGDKIVAFDETDPIRVNGQFYVRGVSCTQPAQLTTRTGGNAWDLDLTGGGTVDVQYAEIAWSNASAPVTATNSRNSGNNNPNWTIGGCGGTTTIAPSGLNVDFLYRSESSNPQPLLSWFVRNGGAVDRSDVEVYSSPRSNQAALWRFDGSGADAVGTWNLTPGGAATYPAGRFGTGVNLGSTGMDGGDLDLTGDFTVDGWVKTTLPTGDPWPDVIYKGNNAGTLINDRLGFNVGAGTFEAQSTGAGGTDIAIATTDIAEVADGTWHHVGMVMDNNRISLYVDGEVRDTETLDRTTVIDTVADGLAVGYELGGMLDDVRVSTVAYGVGDMTGFYRTGRRHQDLIWDADPTDTNGVAITGCGGGLPLGAAPCNNGARANIQFAGGDDKLRLDGARYWVRARMRTQSTATWSNWSDYDYWDTVQAMTASVTTGAEVALASGASMLPGQDALGTATFQVVTSNVHGYSAYVTGPSDTWAMSDGLTGATHEIPGRGTVGTPTAWAPGTAGFFGVSVLSATGGKDTSRWGAGTDTSNLNLLNWGWGGRATPMLLNTRSAYDPLAQDISMAIRANAPPTADPGTYTTTLVFTAVPNV